MPSRAGPARRNPPASREASAGRNAATRPTATSKTARMPSTALIAPDRPACFNHQPVLRPAPRFKGFQPAPVVHRDRREKLARVAAEFRVEAENRRPWTSRAISLNAISAMCDLPSWKTNTGTPRKPRLPALPARSSSSSITSPDVDHRIDLAGGRFLSAWPSTLPICVLPPRQERPVDQPLQRFGVADEFRRLALAHAAEINELDVERPGLADGVEHLRPAARRQDPRSAAGSSWRRRGRPPACRARGRNRLRLAQEGVDLAGFGPFLGRFGRAFRTGTGVFLSLIVKRCRCRAGLQAQRWMRPMPRACLVRAAGIA